MTSVQQREQEFHDRVFAGSGRAGVGRFYAITGASRAWYARLLADAGRGGSVLEYGCGPGSSAFDLALQARSVTGIDISPVAIDRARRDAAAAGLANVEFRQMDAQRLEFEPNRFDLVCGSGILHHVDIRQACSEIRRVLGSSGTGVFFEPLAHNPLIDRYRRRTPELRTKDEHPLTMTDLEVIGSSFHHMECRFFHLTSLGAIPLAGLPGGRFAVRALDMLDTALFRVVPLTRRYAWIVVIRVCGARPVVPGSSDRPT